MKIRILFLSFMFVSIFCQAQIKSTNNFTKYVDPFIGTADHGHVFLGANVPSGAVQLGPSNIMQKWDKFNGWDWCSGYNYKSEEILGFTHTHLSGTGIGDLNDILILPANGAVQTTAMQFGKPESGYGSNFSHQNEICRPGYYKAYLDKYKVTAELTATERVGFHQYQFNKTDNAHLLVDLSFGMGWDAPTDTYLKKINNTTFLGYRFSKGWAKNQQVYFAIILSEPSTKFDLYDSTQLLNKSEGNSKYLKAAIFFDATKNQNIKIKVGLSPVSSENALKNIVAEIPDWNFNAVVEAADQKWNSTLSKIKIEADEKVKTIFYTALYHSNFFPSIFNDANGDYLGTDKKVYHNATFTNYTVFSLWDTYRGFHPLMTIIEPQKVNDYIRSFLAIYKQQGKLPVWHLQGNETNTMIGYPAVPIVVDAYLKGFRDYDVNLAYEAIKQSAMQDTNGISYIKKLGFVPADKIEESVAKAQEYAISDYCIALMAKDLGKKEDAEYFNKRAKLYQLYYDSTTEHMRGRMSNGTWRTPFNPFSAEHRANDYCEGNAWQYTWLVPHDPHGLIQLFGGDKKFLAKLNTLFNVSSEIAGDASPDISGMIGQYAHGNEPNHHIPYLFNFAGEPYKTASLIRQIVDTFYTTKANGLVGNDDVGELSVWYVFSAVGFYPVNPANGTYILGSPLVNEATITSGNNKFQIKVLNNNKNNKYIQHIVLNGKPYSKSFIKHKDIVSGGSMQIFMGAKPNLNWGTKKADRPL